MEVLITVILALVALSAADASLWPQPAHPKRRARKPHRATWQRPLGQRPRRAMPTRRPKPAWGTNALARSIYSRSRTNIGPLWWWE